MAFGQQPRNKTCLPRIGKPTGSAVDYQIFLHATLQTPNPVCTCLLTSARDFTNTYTVACYYCLPFIATHIALALLLSTTGVRPSASSQMCQDTLGRHPRACEERGDLLPPRPPTPHLLNLNSVVVFIATVMRPRSPGSHNQTCLLLIC